MIVLHEANETKFNNWGLGILSDAIEPEVVEELNGQFYMEMKYPVTGNNYSEIKVDRLLRADASQRLKDQLFRIVRVLKKPNALVQVFAEHVSNYTADLQLKPEVSFNGNAQQVLNQWSTGIVTDHPFEVYSNITSTQRGVWKSEEVENARQALGGVEGSVLDRFGGEYLFDNYNIRLVNQRGVYNDIPILYGKNLVDLDQEEEIASTYTSIMPYATYQPEDEDEVVTLTLPEYFIDSEHVHLYARRKILKIDFSSDDITTVESLRKRTKQFIEDNNVGIPKVSLKVRFIELSKTVDYQGIARAEEIGMGDRVIVEFMKLGVSQRAKVIVTRFNPVTKQYNEIEVGELRASLTTSIDAVVDGQVDRLDKEIEQVQAHANGKNKIFRGNNRPTKGVGKNDLWYRPIGDNQVELYQYDGGSWQLIVHDGMSDDVRHALEEAEKNIEESRLHVDNLDKEANSILAGLGVKPIGNVHTETVTYIRQNVKDRIDEVEELENGTRRIIAEIKRNPEGELIGYQTVKETTELYERIIGGTSSGIEGVKSNMARVVMADNIFRTEIKDGITGVNSRVTLLAQSFDVRINDGDSLVSVINASTKGVYVKGKDITFDGEVFTSGDFTITGNMIADTISASKISAGILNANLMNVINLNADSISSGSLSGITIKGGTNDGFYVPHDADGVYNTFNPKRNDGTGNGARWKRDDAHYIYQDPYSIAFYMSGEAYKFNSSGITGNKGSMDIGTNSGSVSLRPSSGLNYSDGHFRPYTTNKYWLGHVDYRWTGLMLGWGSVVESSDARLKDDIQTIPDKLVEYFSEVQPKSYIMGGVRQFGYIAQDVERALFRYATSEYGLDVAKQNKETFNMVGKDESYLSLVYRQVSAIKDAQKDKQIKELQLRLEALENGTATNSH